MQHKENEKERKTGHGKKWIVGKREREKERQKREIKCRRVQKENQN